VRAGTSPEAAIERLGWLFVAKARQSFDPGFYTLAEQCARALDSRKPGSSESWLLRGHVLHSQHHFGEAEGIATKLVAQRGLALDYGLLGDILVDVGRLDEAAGAYQTMLDLKPDPQGYARAAHIRWLKGDLTGALEVMRMAADGASPSDPESAAWMHSQLARYLWQIGQTAQAESALRIALAFQTNFAPALLLRGRLELAAAKINHAIQSLRRAAEANPLPEYHWALCEALRAGHREDEAITVEAQINLRGAASDPRTCSLYLATTRRHPEKAENLARKELAERADIFTHDALAWALAASGKFEEAQTHLSRALAEGTQDARLFLHATVIAAQTGKLEEARRWMAKANPFSPQLLPSEREHLRRAAEIIQSFTTSSTSPANTASPGTFPAVASNPTDTEN
jgi:tetratricopeptide (TPR) repeat protein